MERLPSRLLAAVLPRSIVEILFTQTQITDRKGAKKTEYYIAARGGPLLRGDNEPHFLLIVFFMKT